MRKQVEKERAPSLWILPQDARVAVKNASSFPRASLLGLPLEIRQKILLTSYDVGEMAKHEYKLADTKSRRFSTYRKTFTEIFGRLERPLTPLGSAIIDKVSDRITNLCCVSVAVRNDMRWVSKQWQSDIEAFLHKKIDENVLSFPEFVTTQGPLFTGRRQKSVVVKGDDRPLGGTRPGKCWYCTERHTPEQSGCPRANEDPEQWLRDTREVGGWRNKAQVKNSFQGTKVVFSD